MKRFIVIVVVWVCLSSLQMAVAQEAEPSVEISPALLEQIEGIEDYVVSVRGLEALEPVERIFPTRQEAIDYMLDLYETEFPEDEIRRLAQFYIAFDLLPADTDYMSSYLDLLSAQIGGFYEPSTKQMNTLLLNGDELGDELPLLEQIVYAHEYTHALQDQHFDLTAVQGAAGDNRDYAQAILSLIEGDATLVMNAYTQDIAEKNPFGTALQLLVQGLQTNTLTLPPGTPPVIESELLSAYLDGSVFVNALLQEGGWEAVDAAYENLPQSSEQILHPQKYLNGETPMTVTLEEDGLGEEWETVWDNTMGEFYLRLYLQTQLPSIEANRAAAGWGGDHFRIFHHAGTDELAWMMRLDWDTPTDADEFTDAYTEFASSRFDDALPEGDCWSDDDSALRMVESGDSHLLVSAPDMEMAAMLMDSQG